jgi:hypothetical protein
MNPWRPCLLLPLAGCWLEQAVVDAKIGASTGDSEPTADTEAPDDTEPAVDTDGPIETDLGPICPDQVVDAVLGDPLATGTTAGSGDDARPSCAERTGGLDTHLEWQADRSGCYIFSLRDSDHDTVLSLLRTCDGPELACNDDALKEEGVFTSEIHQDLSAGERLVIAVDAWSGGQTGDWSLSVERRNGYDLDADLGSATGQLVASTTLFADTSIRPEACVSSGADQLYTWTAPERGTWRLDNHGTDFDAVLSVHRLCDPEALVCADNLQGGTEEIDLTLDAGETVVLRVAGYGLDRSGLVYDRGDFVLHATLLP